MTLRDLLPEAFNDPAEDPNYVIAPILEAFTTFEADEIKPQVVALSHIVDIDTTNDIDLLLLNLGNPFNFVLDTAKKRALARALIAVYRLKGTREGIISAIRFFTGYEATIFDSTDVVALWELGRDRLGVETYLGAGRDSMSLFTFVVQFQACVWTLYPDDLQLRAQIDAIVEFMKPGWTRHYLVDCLEVDVPFYEGYEGEGW